MKGVPSTGVYGDLTAAALVQAILAAPGDLPIRDLAIGAESNDVARLQTILQRLGYMDLVTGYYGEITADAVTSFQHENGIYATGTYGALTRMALAARMRPTAAREEIVVEEVALTRVAFVAFSMYPY